MKAKEAEKVDTIQKQENGIQELGGLMSRLSSSTTAAMRFPIIKIAIAKFAPLCYTGRKELAGGA